MSALRAALAGLLWLTLALGGAAQQALPVQVQEGGPARTGQLRSPILTIDSERLFAESAFGRRIQAEIIAAGEALVAENRRIEAELTAEEQSLTERRAEMEPEAFRAAADEFDGRVQQIRAEQDAKEQALQSRRSEGRDAFFAAATPTLGRLMLDANAVVILERRSIFLSAGLVDVTDEAIAAVDAAIGDGSAPEETPADAPEETPAEAPED